MGFITNTLSSNPLNTYGILPECLSVPCVYARCPETRRGHWLSVVSCHVSAGNQIWVANRNSTFLSGKTIFCKNTSVLKKSLPLEGIYDNVNCQKNNCSITIQWYITVKRQNYLYKSLFESPESEDQSEADLVFIF